MNKQSLLLLYRHILKSAVHFPSKNKLKIIKEIKVTFRVNKSLSEPSEINKQIKLAVEGLEQLSMYSNLKFKSGDWSVNMQQQPMPPPSPNV